MKTLISLIFGFTLLIISINATAQNGGYVREAYKAMKSGNYEKAVELYDKAIETYQSYSPSWYGRGLAYAHLGKYESSISDLSKAISLEPYYNQAY